MLGDGVFGPVLSLLVLAACGGSNASSRPAPSATAEPPPAWFTAPPSSPLSLYFVGDATQSAEESIARDLAVQKALHNLTVYVGASVKSSASAVDREHNGVMEQVVSVTVDVAGEEMTIREAVVKKVVVQHGSAGSFDAYALIEWPKGQYEAVLASQRDRARRALDLYLSADAATGNAELGKANESMDEAEKLLGPNRSVIPLEHPKIKDSTVLRTALDALRKRVREIAAERVNVCAVGVLCQKNGSRTPCTSSRLGVFRQAVAKSGRKVATQLPTEGVLEGILSSGQLAADDSVRSAGCVVAIQLNAELLEAGDPFTYVRYGARTVVYDTSSSRIVHSSEVPPTKMGHTSFDAAMNKGFDQAEKIVADEIVSALSRR
jgi:hypothetical protein